MSEDSWKNRANALENEYFKRKESEALSRLKERKASENKVRLSPVTGEPMEEITIGGVVVDRCPTTKGIYLDDGELDQLIQHAQENTSSSTWLADFIDGLRGK